MGRQAINPLYGQRGSGLRSPAAVADRSLDLYTPADMIRRWPVLAYKLSEGEDITVSVGPYTTDNSAANITKRSQQIRITRKHPDLFTIFDCSELIGLEGLDREEKDTATVETLDAALHYANGLIAMFLRGGKQYLHPDRDTQHTVEEIEARLDALAG